MKGFRKGFKVLIFLPVTSSIQVQYLVSDTSWLLSPYESGWEQSWESHRLALGRLHRDSTWRYSALVSVFLLFFLDGQRYKDVLQ